MSQISLSDLNAADEAGFVAALANVVEYSPWIAEQLAQAGYKARVMGWSGPGTNRPAGPLAGVLLIAPVSPGLESGRGS